MKIIDELLEILSSSGGSIEDALIKAQVIAHRLGDAELAAWVKGELQGYPVGSDLPDYRIQHLTVLATLNNGLMLMHEQVLPLWTLTEKQYDAIAVHRVRQGVGGLSHQLRQESDGGNFRVPVDPAFYPALSKTLSPGHVIVKALGVPSPGATQQIITQVRSRLLGFVLGLQDRVPPETAPEAIKDAVTPDVVRTLVGGITGSTVTVNIHTGSGALSSVVQPQQVQALKDQLRQAGISAALVDELDTAIATDESGGHSGKDGPGRSVLRWVGDVIKAAAKTGTVVVVKAAIQAQLGIRPN